MEARPGIAETAWEPAPRPNLKRYRGLLGLTQEQLAEHLAILAWERNGERVGVDRAMISKWERGVRRPRRYYRDLLCLLYKVTPETLGFDRRSEPLASPSRALPSCPNREGLGSLTFRELLPLLFEALSEELGPHLFGCATLDGVERRELLASLLGAAASAALPPSGAQALAAGQPEPLVRDGPVQSVRSITRHYRRLWASTPAKDLINPVLGHLRLTSGLLGATRSETDSVQLAAAAGETAMLAAWLAQDSWNDVATRRHHQAALAFSERAGDDLLRAYTLADMSRWARTIGHGSEAVTQIERAQSLLPRNAPPACIIDLTGYEAMARASAHDPSAALDALQRAERILDRAGEQDEPPRPWVFPVNHSLLAAYRVSVAIRLKLPKIALPALQASLKRLGATPTKPHVYTLSNAAYARTLSGEIEEACHLAGEALAIATQLEDQEGLERVRKVRGQMEPWRATKAVMELDDRLRAAVPLP